MREELCRVRIEVEELLGGKSDVFLGVDRVVLLGELEDLLVGKEETVLESGPDRVLDVALPQDTPERRVGACRWIFIGLAYRLDPPDAHDDPVRVFRERCFLSVNETQRGLGLDAAEKGVEKRELVLALLPPSRSEAHARLAVFDERQIEEVLECLAVLFAHPTKGYTRRRVGRHLESNGFEVSMSLLPELDVGM